MAVAERLRGRRVLAIGTSFLLSSPLGKHARQERLRPGGLRVSKKLAGLANLDNAAVARIARSLNNRPRKTLGYMKPSEKLAELIACTG